MIYEAVNQPVLGQIPKTTKRILDVGCGTGAFGRQVKQRIDCEVVGVTNSEQEAALAGSELDRAFVCDLNSFDPVQLGEFDCIICSHVLEHLYCPQVLLNRLRSNLSANGVLIVALPNILHWKQRFEFLRGRFRYANGGLTDQSHFRFFDWRTSLELIRDSGFIIVSRSAEGSFPLPWIRKLIPNLAQRIDRIATHLMPGLFGFQFIIVAKKT